MKDYQSTRATDAKFELISSQLDFSEVRNALDIGCNEGFITAQLTARGIFAVGLDIAPHFVGRFANSASPTPAFGVLPITPESVTALPEFDAVFLLSVHHQWTKLYGDGYSRRLVEQLFVKVRRHFVIEFAAISSKYGFADPPFRDNDDASVVSWAQDWLRELKGVGGIRYLGRNPEHQRKEPFRHLFAVSRLTPPS